MLQRPPIQAIPDPSTFAMPSVVGLTVADAEKRVVAAGRNTRTTSARAQIVDRRTDARPAGQIIAQLEAPGTPMRPYMDDVGGVYGQVVFRVVVSTGPPAPTTFPMPRVVGLTVPQAQERVVSAGRGVGTRSARAAVEYRADERPAGQIVEQLDAPGTQMRPYLDDVGGVYGEVTFRVIVSTGPQLAPNFLRQHLRTAQDLARQQEVFLTVGDAVPDPATPQGIIVRQEPAPGQPMSRRQVAVWPSAGYPLPNYVSRPVGDARIESQRLGFALDVRGEESLDVPIGTIFRQDPPPGTLLPLEGPVTLTVSRGWPVPQFVRRSEREAEAMANEIRITIRRTEQDNFEVPAGIIFSQQPEAGSPLPSNRVVNVTVSRGYPLPDLTGKTENEARRIASDLRFRLESSRAQMRDRGVDLVDQQSPAPGTRLPFEEPVRIVVSDGWRTPDFLTLEENDANALALEQQVALAVTERRQDRATPAGIVIDQSPRPGSLLPPGQAVDVVVSSGYPTPRFIGLAEAEAKALAERDGIVLETKTEASMDFDTGTVAGQSPQPGVPLPMDSRVSVLISSGWPTPDFVGETEEDANSIATTGRITLIKTEPREDFDLSAGRVVAQRPSAGLVMPANRRVEIALSLGWPVAPDAVGRPASTVEEEFLARYPNAVVHLRESMLTLEPVGTVISQQPAANVKLDRDQGLRLVSAAEKPLWIWPAIGLLALAATVTAFRWPKARASSPTERSSTRSDDLSGIRLRVAKDPGVQTMGGTGGEDDAPADAGEIVEIRVSIDLGEQTVRPTDDKGN